LLGEIQLEKPMPIRGRAGWTWRSALAAIALVSPVVLGQSGTYAIPSANIDSGGGRAAGPSFVVEGTIGQPDASGAMTGGVFALSGGFWHANAPSADGIFANGFE
jgi:hypothetical protein